MNNLGFIPLKREPILDSEWFNYQYTVNAGENETVYKTLTYVMLSLLFKANFKDAYGLKRGQCVVGSLKSAKEWNMSKTAVNRILTRLEKMGEIKCERKPGIGTTITLLKYDEYVLKPAKKGSKKKNEENEGGEYDHYFDDAVQF